MALTEVQVSQTKFLMGGGMFELPLQQLRAKGVLPSEYVFREYPKMIALDSGDTIVVNSAEEEDRVLAGGLTTAQIEEERQALLTRCRSLNMSADPAWSVVRLRRELGEKLDAPEPVDRMSKLEAELAYERKIAAMEAEIAELKARRVATPAPIDDVDAMRAELMAAGVEVDGRWAIPRLRKELDRLGEQP